ncbi:hypothetical protein, partial [Mesorhizobium sp. M1A.F.Ca.IN.022.07.1.1]|uniref:hypothetical protein n=1 Tax=Mesorhizobium sp. M1A.F.Ca.IN.022.07.1.1 TaxID=2496767 RepID=UPI0019D22FA1
ARPLDVRQFVPFGHPSRSESEPSEHNESTPNRVENPECRLDLDRPPAENPGRTLAIVLAVGLTIIALFFIGFRYSERDQGALIVPGTVQGSK